MVTPHPFANPIDGLQATCLHAETQPLADARWARGRMPTATAAYRADLLFRPPYTCNRALGTSRFHHNAGHVGLRLIQSHGWPDRDLASGIGEAIMADYALKHGKRSMPAAWLTDVPYGRM